MTPRVRRCAPADLTSLRYGEAPRVDCSRQKTAGNACPRRETLPVAPHTRLCRCVQGLTPATGLSLRRGAVQEVSCMPLVPKPYRGVRVAIPARPALSFPRMMPVAFSGSARTGPARTPSWSS